MNRFAPWLTLVWSLAAGASEPDDFARQWTVLGDCPGANVAAAATKPALACEGAFAVSLDESVYRQVLRPDLADLAAFNGEGQALPFGPMPAAYQPAKGRWQEASWFALPAGQPGQPEDLHLHVTRSAAGGLSLDASLRHAPSTTVQDLLIDVRAKDREIEAIEFELALDAPDFSAQVDIDASDDLRSWRNIVAGATVAQLRQGGQALVRRHIEFAPQAATYLRVHVAGGGVGLPLRATRLLLHPLAPDSDSIARNAIAADFVRREGRAYVYQLPARVPVERLNIALGDDNAIASFSVSARDAGERDWRYVGQLNAFRLRAAGLALDNEAMDIEVTRRQQWRIESSIELARTPTLQLSYRPESWLLLTHGKGPFVVAAGSPVARRENFPLLALVGQVRQRYGRQWLPAPASLGPMRNAGGDAALSAYDPERKRTWLLWSVLLLGAAVIVAMVLRLLKAPDRPD
jgi:hypothetical protein